MNILIIEDDPLYADTVKLHLNDALPDHTVEIAPTLREGKLKSLTSDVVILDLGLPDSSGWKESLVTIHEAVPTKPIILLTGSEDKYMIAESIQYGVRDYFYKGTFSPADFTKSVELRIDDVNRRRKLMGAKIRIELGIDKVYQRALAL